MLIYIVIIALFLAWFFTSFYGAEFYIAEISSIFDFSTNKSNLERYLQFNSLMDEIVQTPLFGAGAGAAAQYNRSIEQPWAYELVYVAFLFHYGVIGFLLYGAGILLLVCHLIAQVRETLQNYSP